MNLSQAECLAKHRFLYHSASLLTTVFSHSLYCTAQPMSAELVTADVLPLIAFHGTQGCSFDRLLYYCSRSLTAAHTVSENTFPQWTSVTDALYTPISVEEIIDQKPPSANAAIATTISHEVINFPELLDDANLIDDPALTLSGIEAPIDFDFDANDAIEEGCDMPSCPPPETIPVPPSYTPSSVSPTAVTPLRRGCPRPPTAQPSILHQVHTSASRRSPTIHRPPQILLRA